MVIPLIVLILAAGWRLVALHVQELSNFSPIMALAFCSGVYFRKGRMWMIPFAALLLSDLYIDHYYAVVYKYDWSIRDAVIRLLCFGIGVGFGLAVSRHRTWLRILMGLVGSSVVFYLATNTAAWSVDAGYAKTAAGWFQAMTVGHPQYPPTIYFFRNTLASDFFFTGVFALAMEYRAFKAGETSLFAKKAGA